MKSTSRRHATIVGLFLFFGLIILVAGILTIGNLHNSFVAKFTITTIFDEVNGLQPGNNIWFSGVKIGTVSSLEFYGTSQVKVDMKIDRKAQPYIRKNAKAKISTDGLIGNKIVVIYGGSDSVAMVSGGDTLGIEKTLSTDDMLNTLQENNKNILAITGDIKLITKKIVDGEGTLGKLLGDESMYDGLTESLATLKIASEHVEKVTASLVDYTKSMNTEGSLAHDLVSDTVVFATLRNSISELKGLMASVSAITSNIRLATSNLNNTASPVGVILNDEPAALDLKATLRNLESSTRKLDEDLEALQHNFLLRRYFKKKADK